MYCLGIESTAHTFGIGILNKKGKVLAHAKSAYTTKAGGIIPGDAADHHGEVCSSIIGEALTKAGLCMQRIDLIAYARSPGIGHTLRIGAMVAKTLAALYKKPIIGVNHCIAHLEIGRLLTKAKDPVLLYASGANTQIIAYEAGVYRIFGETLDQGVGNFLDSLARHMGLGFPGGPHIYTLSQKSKRLIELPYTVKGMDVGFGGLLTHCKKLYDSQIYTQEDLCYSVQETVFAMLLEVSERAMAHTGKKELLFGGGVCCNRRLQNMAHTMCHERKATCFIPANEYMVDNGAMIAWLGLLMYQNGKQKSPSIDAVDIDPYERTDDVAVYWR
ncbi:tRNA (adenosine(37)-N6)-threonylcarbamoyltransferase complex transferase subunit TsaD [Candidatus Woesearchaeota archaeon]|nr:tRNA (adenosine(37)-N6)-threonylcarbamoyltransferase complex transferase subunit TsaD [Candidatus Woesearchaeota archaeon]